MITMQYLYPTNWYWRASSGKVWGSANQSIVSADDPAYVAWLVGGGVPTAWPKDDAGAQTTAALHQVVTQFGMYADLESGVRDALSRANARADAVAAQATSRYPRSEIDSWPSQLAEARLVSAGETPSPPSILQSLVDAAKDPSVTLASVAAAVMAKASAYHQIVAAVQVMRTQAEARLKAATGASQIPGILQALKSDSDARAVALGFTPPT